MRLGLGRPWLFVKGRDENLRRVSEMAHLLNESGTVCICSLWRRTRKLEHEPKSWSVPRDLLKFMLMRRWNFVEK